MVIQHNISAVNAYRNLNNNTTALNKNLEKLSSGYRINRAADDAAGLAISEQMRSKIAGLDQSVSNANDGIGLIQTAEGALSETHSMLQRMTTLATQAANGTYNSKARANIQLEVNELSDEITRIAESTEYNGFKMLGGATVSVLKYTDATTVAPEGASKLSLQIGPTASQTLEIKPMNMKISGIFDQGDISTVQSIKDAFSKYVSGVNSYFTASRTQKAINTINVMTVSKANHAVTAISKAIGRVSSYRALLGAKQNRLEHTINNLKVTSENVTSAESRIRDTDMASEMAAYTKNNVLVQAATSMLAQANQSGQSVLSLLQ
jgi:flagellin